MQKKIKWGLILVLLGLVLASSLSCNPLAQKEQEVTEQPVEVVRGDLAVTISGSGNIDVAKEIKLAFGVGGRIGKIYVEEGDEVGEGEVLAKLETDALELALTQAQVAQVQAQLTAGQAQVAVTQAEVAVTQAQLALQTAEYNLKQTQSTYTLSDIKVAQTNVDKANRALEEALWQLSKYDPGTPGWESYQKIVIQAELRLNAAEDSLEAMLSGTDTEEVAIKKLQVEAAKQSVELAKQSVELAKQSLELAKQSFKPAEQAVEVARKQLDEATIIAPFDGIVADVGVDEQDTVSTATTIIHLIDPGSMELEVQVDEMDIPEVTPGQKAIIKLDALPALPVEGEVSFISLLPTVEAGLIVYDVKIDFGVPEGSGIRLGMSATADIVIAERKDVLLVPDRAIKEDSRGNPIVDVMVNGQSEERAVVIGVSDGSQTEILSGLAEGEVVVEKRSVPKPSGQGFF